LYDALVARCKRAPEGVTLVELKDALPEVGGGKLEAFRPNSSTQSAGCPSRPARPVSW
jgi:hypothetical protein